MPKISKIEQYTKEEFANIIANSNSYKDALRNMGYAS